MPMVPNTIMPTITTAASSSICHQYCTSTAGSTIMPTEMKNTDPNRFLIGTITLSMRSDIMVPARIEPMTNAPSSRLNPHTTENTAIEKHSAIDTTISVSSLRYARALLKNVGNTYTPTRNHIIRKKASLPSENSSSVPWTSPMASDDSSTSISTANRSSIISTANTSCANLRCRSPRSDSAFMMMVVDDIDIIPPRKMRFIRFRSRIYPTPNPANVMPVMTISAVTAADVPDFISFWNENSRPMLNISTTIPKSAQKLMLSALVMLGR